MNANQARMKFRGAMVRLLQKYDIKRVTLSKLTGAPVGHINRWTDGDLMPSWYQFERIMQIFGVDAEYLIGSGISEKSYNATFKTGR